MAYRPDLDGYPKMTREICCLALGGPPFCSICGIKASYILRCDEHGIKQPGCWKCHSQVMKEFRSKVEETMKCPDGPNDPKKTKKE